MTDIATKTAAAQAAEEAKQVQDSAALRLGGLSPLFEAEAIADQGRLRLGGLSPLFGRA